MLLHPNVTCTIISYSGRMILEKTPLILLWSLLVQSPKIAKQSSRQGGTAPTHPPRNHLPAGNAVHTQEDKYNNCDSLAHSDCPTDQRIGLD